MKKFKIIEEGRILSPEELTTLKGGVESCTKVTTCSGGHYESCIRNIYVSCKPNAVIGYASTNVCGDARQLTTCSAGYEYTSGE